jgi:hypothetical protein
MTWQTYSYIMAHFFLSVSAVRFGEFASVASLWGHLKSHDVYFKQNFFLSGMIVARDIQFCNTICLLIKVEQMIVSSKSPYDKTPALHQAMEMNRDQLIVWVFVSMGYFMEL